METKRYSAYNSTRGTVLNARLSVVDRELEPLKFLELLIGGLGLDSESGLWLTPLTGIPQVPRVFPFDLIYLDNNQQVIQAVEIFPSVEFPPYSTDVASALILPLHAASSTQTHYGDQLMVSAVEEPAEEPEDEVIQAVPDSLLLHTEALLASPNGFAPLEVPVEPPVSPALTEAPAQVDPEKRVPSRPLTEPLRLLPVEASANRGWELPLEGFWAPQAPGPEATAEPRHPARQPEVAASVLEAKIDSLLKKHATGANPEPDASKAGPALPDAGQVARASLAIAHSTPPAVQSVDSTVAQYRTWQVSNSTVPVTQATNKKAPGQKSAANGSSDPRLIAAAAEAGKKHAEKSTGSGRRPETPAERSSDVPPDSNSTAQAFKVPRRNFLHDAAKAASATASSRSAPVQTTTEQQPAMWSDASTSTADPVANPDEPSLAEWITLPDPAPLVVLPPAPPVSSRSGQNSAPPASRGEKPTPVGSGDAGAPKSKSDARMNAAHPPFHIPSVPEVIAGLKDALQSIGKPGRARAQSPAKPQDPAKTPLSAWMNPEALHRDRRRAVRRTVPGMVAFYFTGGAPQPYTVADISATGFYLVTRDQWSPETMIQMTLQKPASDGKTRKESITVLTKIVRKGADGIGAEFVMPESLDPHSREIRPGRATDRMVLARFLLSEGFPDSVEVLGCVLTPPVKSAGKPLSEVAPAS